MPSTDALPLTAQRILGYGVTGSGKSTLAQRIGDLTGLPVTLVDELTWLPGWVEVEEDEQRRMMSAICADDKWVLDTAYGRWLDVPFARVELIVALDYPRWLSLWRLVRRTLHRVTTKTPVCNGNIETWGGIFSSDSIIAWHFRSFKRKRQRIRAWAEAPEGPPVLHIRKPRELEQWLEEVASSE